MKLLACQNFAENHEANCRNLRKFDTKLLNKKHEPILKQTKIWKIVTTKNARLYRTRNFAKNPNLDLQDSKRQFGNQLNF
jgi:hypothetical protein